MTQTFDKDKMMKAFTLLYEAAGIPNAEAMVQCLFTDETIPGMQEIMSKIQESCNATLRKAHADVLDALARTQNKNKTVVMKNGEEVPYHG